MRFGFVRRMLGLQEKRSTDPIDLNDSQLRELLDLGAPGEVNVRGKKALKVDIVYACIKILSESVSKLPLKIYQEDENGIQKTAKHSLKNLLRLRPNPLMSASDFWKCVESQRAFGNAYVFIDFHPKTGEVIGLWPIDHSKVTVWIDDVGLLSNVGGFVNRQTRLWYEVNVNGERRKLMPTELLHFKGSVTLDGIVGLNPIEYLRSTIENAASAGKFINNFYKQGLQVKGLIQYVGDLNDNAKRTFREQFESMSSGLKNSHRISLMPIGYQFVPISLTMADAQFLENTQLTIRQVAAAFGVKMHQINELERATFNNVEQMQMQFYQDTLQPILTGYEQELTWKLFTNRELEAGFYSKFNVDSILRGDIKTRYEAHRTGVQGGFITPNEARAKEDLPPLPGGDQLVVNGSYIPLTMAGKQYQKGGGSSGKAQNKGNKGNSGATGNAGSQGDNGRGNE